MPPVIEWITKYWVNWVCGIIAALIGILYRKVVALKKEAEDRQIEEKKNSKALQDAMVALMRDRIFQSCRYHLKNGFVTTGDLEVLNAMYDSYHKLGGDTIATTLVERVNKLKIMIEDIH